MNDGTKIGVFVAGTFLYFKNRKGSDNKKTTGTIIFSATWSMTDVARGNTAEMHQKKLKKALMKLPFINQVQIITMGYVRDEYSNQILKEDEIEIDVAGKTKAETLLAIRPVLHNENWNLSNRLPPEFIHRY